MLPFCPKPRNQSLAYLGALGSISNTTYNEDWAPWDGQPPLSLPPRRWILPFSPSRLGSGSSSWVHHFKMSWTIHQRKPSLASCQDSSSTSACECCWAPAIGMYYHGDPLCASPSAGQSHRTPLRAPRHPCLHLSAPPDSCYPVPKQCSHSACFQVLPHICRIPVADATASE